VLEIAFIVQRRDLATFRPCIGCRRALGRLAERLASCGDPRARVVWHGLNQQEP
jgi:hypothetical protein